MLSLSLKMCFPLRTLNFPDTFALLTVTTAPVTAGFTQGLVPDIQSVMGGLNSAFESGGLEGYLSAMPEAFGNIAGLIQTQIPAIAQDISSSFPTIFSTIAQTLPQILPVIIDSLLNVFSSLLNVLSSQGPSILTALISALNQAVQGLLAMLPQLITVGLQLIIALVQGLAMAAPTLIPAHYRGTSAFVRTCAGHYECASNPGVNGAADYYKSGKRYIGELANHPSAGHGTFGSACAGTCASNSHAVGGSSANYSILVGRPNAD